MNTRDHSSKEQQHQAAADKPTSDQKTTKSFKDNRPVAIAQRKLQQQADAFTTNQSSIIQQKPNQTGLPDNLKSGMEQLSGQSLDDVKVHFNSSKPAQLNAHAYAQGNQIHLGTGQEKHLAHEAWHVVQQKQGRVQPTTQMKGNVKINDDVRLEKEADVMGAKAMQLKADPANQATIQRMAISAAVVQLNKRKDDLVRYLTNSYDRSRVLYNRRKELKISEANLELLDQVTRKLSFLKGQAEALPDDDNRDKANEIKKNLSTWKDYLGYNAWEFFESLHLTTKQADSDAADKLAAEAAAKAQQDALEQAKNNRLKALKTTNDAAIKSAKDQVIALRKANPTRNGINAGKNAGLPTIPGGSDNQIKLDKGIDTDEFTLKNVTSYPVTDSDSAAAKVVFANGIFIHIR